MTFSNVAGLDDGEDAGRHRQGGGLRPEASRPFEGNAVHATYAPEVAGAGGRRSVFVCRRFEPVPSLPKVPPVRSTLGIAATALLLLGCGSRTGLGADHDEAPDGMRHPGAFEQRREFVMRANNMLTTLRWTAEASELPTLEMRFAAIDTDGMGFVRMSDAAHSLVSGPSSIEEEVELAHDTWTAVPLPTHCEPERCDMQFYFGHSGGNTLHPATIDLRVRVRFRSAAVRVDDLEIVVHSYDD